MMKTIKLKVSKLGIQAVILFTTLLCMNNAFADSWTSSIQSHNPKTLEVVSNNGKTYTQIISPADSIDVDFRVSIDAGNAGRVKSWSTWLVLDTDAWGQEELGFKKYAFDKSYKRKDRPKKVNRVVGISVPQDEYSRQVLGLCHNLAIELRDKGLSNEQIFSRDRIIRIRLYSPLNVQFSGRDDGEIAEGTPGDGGSLPNIRVICKKWSGIIGQGSQELAGEEIVHTVVSSSLSIRETSGHAGVCKVSLSGVIRSRLPKAPVRFKYLHTSNTGQTKWSQEYEVMTDHSKTAMFSHEFKVPNKQGKEEGTIRIVGMDPEFTSSIEQYEMDCKEPATTSFGISRPPKVSMDFISTGKIMVGKYLCPTSLRLHGVIEGQGAYTGNAIFIGDSYLSNVIPYEIEDGQTKHISARRSISWINTGTSGTSPTTDTLSGNVSPYKIVSLYLNLTNRDNKVIASTPRRDYRVECTIPKFTPGTTGSGELGVVPKTPISKQPSKKFGGKPQQVQPQAVPKTPVNKAIQPKQMKIIKQN